MAHESFDHPNKALEVPLLALRTKSRSIISQLLYSTKIIPSPNGLPRDWRGLAHIAGIISPPASSPDPVAAILAIWEKQKPSPTVAQLQACFGQIDRWDVLDDSATSIEEDIEEYLKRKQSGSQGCELVKHNNDNHILTVDDIDRVEQNLEPQIYDAFLLFADEDIEFAKQIVDKLENKYGLKLCLKDRDLVGGLWFEHEAIMQLISERCSRLIIIISPSFLESSVNKFFVTFAQALGIEQRQRKIIPCVYQRFPLPPQLRHYFVLDYNRAGQFWDFWEKLCQSVNASAIRTETRSAIKAAESYEEKWNSKAVQLCKTKVENYPSKVESYDKYDFPPKQVPQKEDLLLPPKQEKPRPKSPTMTFLRKLLPNQEISSENGKQKSKTKLWFQKKPKKKPVPVES